MRQKYTALGTYFFKVWNIAPKGNYNVVKQ